MRYLTPLALALPWTITKVQAFAHIAESAIWVGTGPDVRLAAAWPVSSDLWLVEYPVPAQLTQALKSLLPTAWLFCVGRKCTVTVEGNECVGRRLDADHVLVPFSSGRDPATVTVDYPLPH